MMNNGRPATLKDIARRAGVTHAAVSVALSGKTGTTHLSRETRDRILRIAGRLGYRRNILGRSLVHRKSFLIGFLGRREYHVYTLKTIEGIQAALAGQDHALLSFYGGPGDAEQAVHLRRCLDRQVDGIIAAVAAERPGSPLARGIEELRALGIPLVQIYRRIHPRVPVVMADDRAVGRLATHHLIGLGHRRIAHFTYDAYRDAELPGTHRDSLHRYEGYARAMREAGLKPVVVNFPVTEYWGPGYSLGARKHASGIAEHPARITAVTVFCDYVAIGLMKGLADLGIRVPQDIAVVGCDDMDAASVVEPPLTTLRMPSCRIGLEAARMVLDRMGGKPVTDRVFEPELVVRSSTAPPAPPAGRRGGHSQRVQP
jgi:LacI family transcriptional regulator